MKSYRLVIGILLLALCAPFMVSADMYAATCTGSAYCRACSSCRYCGHCAKRGGGCGVCTPSMRQPAKQESEPERPDRRAVDRDEMLRQIQAARQSREEAQPEPTTKPAPTLEPVAGAVASEDGVNVFFSPKGGCTDAIVGQISEAEESIRVQAYRLTSVPIAKALAAAHGRGVKVLIVLDGAQQSDKYSDATYFHNHEVPVFIDGQHAIAHNKVMIIDDETIITGSFNFSDAAEHVNAENLLIIKEKPKIAKAYRQNFASHLNHVSAYEPPERENGRGGE